MRRLILAVSVLLAACGKVTPAPTALPTVAVTQSAPTAIPITEAAPTIEIAPTAAETATPAPNIPRLVLITESSEPNASVQVVMQAAAQEFGWGYTLVQNAAPNALEEAALMGGPVLVLDGAAVTEYARPIAHGYRGHYFIALSPLQGPVVSTNLLALEGERFDQLGFLAGMAAGFATETQRVAAVADTSVEGLNYRNGFLHGVRYTCPRCEVKFFEAGDVAAGLYTDVVFVAPGETQAAVLASAAQAGAWVIGAGQAFANGATPGADKLLMSVSLDVGAAVDTAVRNYYAATLGQGFTLTGQWPLSAQTGALVITSFDTPALNSLDHQEIITAYGRLADGSLDTGVDPATGQEK